MSKIKPSAIPYNIPITLDLPQEAKGDSVILDHRGKMHNLGDAYPFELTLPSFLPKLPAYVSNDEVKQINEVRGWDPEEHILQSEIRKEMLKQGLNMKFDVDHILANEISHTHPSWQPWDHQAIDAFILKYSTNMLITHEVRVGKTITAVLGAYNNPNVKKILVICPKIVIWDAWVKTFQEWTDLNITTFTSVTGKKKKEERDNNFDKWANGEIDVLITNIEFFRLNISKFKSVEDQEDLIIIDEGHFLTKRGQSEKQPLTSGNSRAVLEYRLQSRAYMWILTGTPATRYEYDILSLFFMLSPIGRIERHIIAERYNRPIRVPSGTGKFIKDNFVEFFNKFMQIISYPSPSNNWTFHVEEKEVYSAAMEELNSLHRIHRNQKDLWGDPEKFNTYEDIHIPINKKQKKIYQSIVHNSAKLFLDFDNPLVRDIFLRQVAIDHRLMKSNIDIGIKNLIEHEDKRYVEEVLTYIFGIEPGTPTEQAVEEVYKQASDAYNLDVKGAKAEWILEYIEGNKERIQGNRLSDAENTAGVSEENFRTAQLKGRQPLIIFSNFTSFLHLLKEDIRYQHMELRVEMLIGETSPNKRQEIINDFQAGNIDILLANTTATQMGITLNRGDESIFVDRVWSTEVMEQARARIQNPSKPYPKNTKYLMAEDSIDFKVKEFVERKRDDTLFVNKDIVNVVHNVQEDAINEMFRKFMKGDLI